MIENKEKISVEGAMDEILKTSVLQKVSRINDKDFALKLAIWLIRYILVISSMNEALKLDLEDILQYLHGKKFQEILEVKEIASHFRAS